MHAGSLPAAVFYTFIQSRQLDLQTFGFTINLHIGAAPIYQKQRVLYERGKTMNVLIEKLQKLEKLEQATFAIESTLVDDPQNKELEKAFDAAYKVEFATMLDCAKYIECITGSNIDFNTAKKIVIAKRSELLGILTE